MSHECPDCGQACYCDMEDADMGDSVDCTHFMTDGCAPDREDDYDESEAA